MKESAKLQQLATQKKKSSRKFALKKENGKPHKTSHFGREKRETNERETKQRRNRDARQSREKAETEQGKNKETRRILGDGN
jgi:hypothetical protein